MFEREGYLHLLDPATGAVSKLTVSLEPEAIQAMPRYVKAAKQIQNLSLSPAGKARGLRGWEILTVPVEKRDIRNLTRTPGARRSGARLVARRRLGRLLRRGRRVSALKIVDQKGEKPPRVIPSPTPGGASGSGGPRTRSGLHTRTAGSTCSGWTWRRGSP